MTITAVSDYLSLSTWLMNTEGGLVAGMYRFDSVIDFNAVRADFYGRNWRRRAAN